MLRLTAARVALPDGRDADQYPFDVAAVRALATLPAGLAFDRPVTCFVGENGSGKSTLLEGLAVAAGLPAVGSEDLPRDPTLAPARALARRLKLTWTMKADRGFFLRAEDFFGFAKRLARERAEMEQELKELEAEYTAKDRSPYALGLAQGPLRGSLGEMTRRYGRDLDARSHGESFLTLFHARLVPDGLFLLDEPESALSPQRQLGLLAMMKEYVGRGAQFVVATHAPILLAYPGARLYSFDEHPPRATDFDELEHVRLTRDFLAAPERFLRHL
ncbi:ABC transporter ATP-binding protein [Gemmatimonadetes bacterium T265]|nr:ABC transporter ATP-binding protein [Gemmatimonadetes bacterium T265]